MSRANWKEAMAMAGILAIGLVYLAWGVSDQIGLITEDAPSYLMMARSYAHRGQDRVAAEATATSRFPPLYPLVLALTGGADDLQVAHVATIAFFPVALLALFFWQRYAGASAGTALVVTVAAAAVPEAWLSALTLQSEYQYLALSAAALALFAKYRLQPSDGALYGACLCIVLAILTRSIGIVLLAPLFAALWRRGARQRTIATAIVVLPLVMWYSLHRPQNGGYASVLSSYFANVPPGAILQLLVRQASAIRSGIDNALLLEPPWLEPLADVLLALFVSAALVRAFRREPDGLYVVSYVGMLAVWPFPHDMHRLLWPLLPILIAQVPLAAADLNSRRPARATGLAVASCAILVFATALPSIAQAWRRHGEAIAGPTPAVATDPSWYGRDANNAMLYATSAQRLVVALRQLADIVPRTDCVIATRADWVNFYADRHAVAPPPRYVPDAAFGAAVAASGCHYVFASPFFDLFYTQPMYPLQRLGARIHVVNRTALPGVDPAGKPLEYVLAGILADPPTPSQR